MPPLLPEVVGRWPLLLLLLVVLQRMLEMVGLTEKENVATASLSGGQKRKLGVALALIGDPKLVILCQQLLSTYLAAAMRLTS